MRWCASAVLTAAAAAQGSLQPPPLLGGSCFVQVTPVGAMPASGPAGAATNATSPLSVGPQLLLVDQRGWLFRREAAGAIHTLFRPADAPAGVTLAADETLLNVAANAAGDRVYVVFTAIAVPAAVPVAVSPRGNASGLQLLCEYHFDGVALSLPRCLCAFEVNRTGHTGGGLLVLGDGSLLFAIGDNGDAGQDGRSFPQDSASHLGKIVHVQPDGSWTIAAKGVRNVQRLERTPDGARLRFIDIGGRVAEELDEVEIALLRAPAPVANFGWGRNADGLAREGTFYIDSAGFAVGRAPAGETGFIQPAAQWGREQQAFVAGSGPVTIGPGAATIELLCGDLVSGEVYAVSRSFAELAQELHRVALRDAALQPVTLAALAGGRPDPRFFAFPDGSAGVLLERTGAFYRLGELPCSTAGFTAVGSGCGAATLGVEALPRVGTPAVVVLQGSGPGEPAVFLASPVRAVPPLALGAFGMPGCVSHLSGPSVLGFVVCDAVGTARQPVWIPGTVMLCGLELPVQAAVHAPGLNAAAIAMTGAVVLRAGL